MRRKDLEITLQRSLTLEFDSPKIELEQYSTSPRVAANMLFRCHQLGDIEDKNVLDLCAGTGIFGIGALMLGAAKMTSVEIDQDAIEILKKNYDALDLECEIIHHDVLTMEVKQQFDTCIVNPPFGINRASKFKDMNFVVKASELADVIYSIHDGSKTNEEKLPEIFSKNGLKITEMYKDEFPLPASYHFHKLKNKMYRVLVIRSERA